MKLLEGLRDNYMYKVVEVGVWLVFEGVFVDYYSDRIRVMYGESTLVSWGIDTT